jgi:homoserine kinase
MLTVIVPATSANLGPGFDTLGLSLRISNRFAVRERSDGHSATTAHGEGAESLSGTQENLVLRSARRLYEAADRPFPGWDLEIHSEIPLARGLGSSASAVIGGLVAANALMGERFTHEEILAHATALEGHPDNVAPALMGGLTLAMACDGRIVARAMRTEAWPGFVVAVPDFELSTELARKALPSMVSRQDAVYNIARVTLLTTALASGRLEWLADALGDRLHEPHRRALVPGMDAVTRAARDAGAWGVTLSGAGPTLLGWCPPERGADVAAAMEAAWRTAGVSARARLVPVERSGTRIERDF